MRSPIPASLFIFAIAILALGNHFGNVFDLYDRYAWVDTPMHMLGGVCVALSVFAMPFFSLRIPERYFSLVPVLAFALIVGLLWELFEIAIGIPQQVPDFAHDMVFDLVNDLLGGILGFMIGNHIRRRQFTT